MEFNGLVGFKVMILIDTPVGLRYEEFSGNVHLNYEDAQKEIEEAQDNPLYAGYDFDIEDVWM